RGMVVVVVLAAVAFVPFVPLAALPVRRHTRRLFTLVQVKRVPALVRTWPTVLQVVPAMAGAGAVAGASAGALACDASGVDVATGNTPVRAAAPRVIV
ncbi:MAG: hypothetical protein ACKO97_11575, partial [Actinomycetota bacterium]